MVREMRKIIKRFIPPIFDSCNKGSSILILAFITFEAYTKEGFSLESHARLAKLYDELTARGCQCMLTNHNTEFIRELYCGKGYTIEVLDVKRMINSDVDNRKGQEVIICNY